MTRLSKLPPSDSLPMHDLSLIRILEDSSAVNQGFEAAAALPSSPRSALVTTSSLQTAALILQEVLTVPIETTPNFHQKWSARQ